MKKLMFVLLIMVFAAAVFGQDTPTEKRLTLAAAKLSVGFADDWDVKEENGEIIGESADGSVHFIAAVVAAKTINQATGKLPAMLGNRCGDVEFNGEPSVRKPNGLTVYSFDGTCKSKANGEPLEVAAEIVQLNGKIVLAVMLGHSDDLKQNAAAVELTKASFKQVK